MRVPVKGLTVENIAGVFLPVEGQYVDLPDIVTGGGSVGPPGPPGPMGPPGPAGAAALVGVWQPIIGGAQGEINQHYMIQNGHYVKIGPLICVWADLQFGNVGDIQGSAQLKGLPFPVRSVPSYYAGSYAYSSNLSPNAAELTNILLYASGGGSVAFLFGHRLGQNPRPLQGSDFNNASQFICSLMYLTND